MRWLFLLLLVLNAFYYVWGHQRMPVQSAEIPVLSRYSEGQKEIQLVSDTSAQQREILAATSRRVACFYLGGFEHEEVVRQLEQRLLSLDIHSWIEAVDSTVATDYWLYLPPLASRQASLRQLKELQARKIDSYIITQGDLINGISLGIFSRKDSAESVMQRLRDTGYEPAMRELPRAHREYWVRVSSDGGRLLDSALLERLALSFPGLRHEQKNCKDVARPQ